MRKRLAMVAAGAIAACSPAYATARPLKVVRYDGHHITVPASWPVLRVGGRSTVCVRFNRDAVFLGRPSATQNCPSHAAGRPRAVLIEPGRGVVRGPVQPLVRARVARAPVRASAAAVTFTGLGFDVCSAPSASAMQAWAASPYRAVGIYLGGANMACSQPNLTAAWVSAESTAGWHMIPTYVGLQAPSNSCSCAPISARQATAQGTAAADNAVAEAQGLGLGAGTPIYDDMEYYPRTATNTPAVLAFLSAWTAELHKDGYLSGVYGNSDSVMADMVGALGTSFAEPDDVWIANWNGVQSTADAYVPATEWAAHQRIHQYQGGHNATYGGVRLNIDSNYVDAATALGPPTPPSAPTLKVSPSSTGSIALTASWPGVSGILSWQILAGSSPTTLAPFGAPVAGGSTTSVTLTSQFAYFAVEALGAFGSVVGVSMPVATPPHVVIYGRNAFVPWGGIAGLPIGCFAATPCSVSTKLTAGRTVVAQTGPVGVAAGGDRVIYFKLTPAGRKLLSPKPGSRLAVQVSAVDAGGPRATAAINLVPYTTHGTSPARGVTDSPALAIAGATAFTYRATTGAVLAGCFGTAPCSVTATLRHGSAVIAQTHPEQLGVGELGYLVFKLTPQGRALLLSRRGNQLGVSVSLLGGAATAGGRIVLVSYR